jgi:putative tryptophan/tyrosine transport system substrate-binding protein
MTRHGLSRRMLLGCMGAWPLLPMLAQTPSASKPIRIGVLLSGSQAQWSLAADALVEGLREHGYVEDRNLTLLRRYGELDGARIRSSAAELASLDLDAIVTSCSGTALAVVKATGSTPVIMGSISDPVVYGLVESLARPGGKVTGRMSMSLELLPKRLEMLRLLLPPAQREGARIAILMNGKDPTHEVQWNALLAGAQTLKLQLVRVAASGSSAIQAALDGLGDARSRGLLVLSDDPSMIENRARIAAAAIHLRLPSITGSRLYAEAGGLMAYGMDILDDFRLVAAHVVKVAHGSNPATLPVEQPTKVQLTINLKTASAIGLTIPYELRLMADSTIG